MTIQEISSIVTEYLETLPHGKAISTTEALDRIFGCKFLMGGNCRLSDEVIDSMLLFAINDEIQSVAAENGISLDSSYCAGVPVGLPYNIPYHVLKEGDPYRTHVPHFLFQKEGKHTMTWFHLTEVVYSHEYGDPTLPKLAEMVSATPDPHKDIILDYLSEHCIAGCPGIIYDVVNPDEVIGHGHLYSDDKYFWEDSFTNYVRKYNIPVPPDFRAHILENYKDRKLRHAKHRLLKRIVITHSPAEHLQFSISIDVHGNVCYKSSSNHPSEETFIIDPKDADYIVHPIMESIFCYDLPLTIPQPSGGYLWSVDFYNAKGHVCKIEGWPGEPQERYASICRLFEFVEKETGKDLGTVFMDNN